MKMRNVKLNKSQIYEGNLILVNTAFGIHEINEEEMFYVYEMHNDVLLKRKVANILRIVLENINCGDEIVPVSGYRTETEQIQIYKDSLRENGKRFTEKYVALPNHSEHQTGLAIDLGLRKEKIDFIRPDFPYHGICGKFRTEAAKYGFIERYGQDKEAVTGIAHEPWHFRYVGYPHSEIMKDKNLALEEYIEYIKKYTLRGEHLRVINRGIEIFYVPFINSEVVNISVPDNSIYQISGNNVDGVIVTLW